MSFARAATVRCAMSWCSVQSFSVSPERTEGGTHYPASQVDTEIPAEKNFFFFSRSLNSSVFDRPGYAPCFQSVGSDLVRTSHPSGSRHGEFLKESSPAPDSFSAPENFRYHAVSKVIGLQIHWLALPGVQPNCGSRRGRTSDQIISELSRFQGRSSR